MGVGITGIIFYFVFRELFSSGSANSIYSAALDRCIEVYYYLSMLIDELIDIYFDDFVFQDLDVCHELGPPIRGYGEESTRRRRNRVSHAFYERDGAKCIRMNFYIEGTKKRATVQLDMKEVSIR